jgi:hypothetical protein
MFPLTSKLLHYSPLKFIRDFIKAGEEFNKVSQKKLPPGVHGLADMTSTAEGHIKDT